MGIWTMALPGGYPLTALIVALVAGVNARAGFALAGITMIAIAAATWTSLGRPATASQPASTDAGSTRNSESRSLAERRCCVPPAIPGKPGPFRGASAGQQGMRTWASAVPQPVTGSQPGPAW
jgi:hypothetical protein